MKKGTFGLVHLEISDVKQVNEKLLEYIDVIRIQPVIPKTEIVNLLSQFQNLIKIVIIDDVDLAMELKADGVFFSNPESYQMVENLDKKLLIGGLSNNLADCKNWEMVNADFIDFNPPIQASKGQPLGSEGFKDLPSKNEVYGWMLFSLNIPVFIHHPRTLSLIKEIHSVAEIHGVALSGNFDWTENPSTMLTEIRGVFDEG